MAIIIGGIPSETLTGGLAADLISGLGGNDSLTGNEDADTLDGGKGADTLVGGLGNDSYVVDNAKDVITETGGDLDDRVLAPFSVNLGLPAFAGIDHVTLTGMAASGASGNSGANMLIGNAGANKLDGRAGLDTLIGSAGNDLYLVDDGEDLAIENPGDGIDTVIATTIAFTLGDNIENLTVASSVAAGFGAFGNALANKITGNAGGGILSGEGGNDFLVGGNGNDVFEGDAGADTMIGGKGEDTYFVDDLGDKVVEIGPAGQTDEVFTFVSYTLGANLENVSLGGSESLDATGNNLNNLVEGNAGNNVINGLGGNDILEVGPGEDTVIGGTGSDQFQFTDKNLDGLDIIADFNGLQDGDTLRISILGGVLPAGTEADFIQTVVANGSTLIRLDLDGTGAGDFEDAAVLRGVSTDLAGLLANGSILNVGTAATPPIDGKAGADNKMGTGISDLIRGLGGNDTLTGAAGFDSLDGGAGNDSLIGGSESDTYIVNSAGDKIDESGGGTDDRILASVAIDLNNAAYKGVEHATLIGTAALSATGNGGANMLIGNAGANKLDGGKGVDTLIGGAGNDVYLVDDISDVAIENPGEGIDTVIITATTDFKLGANIENLIVASNVAAGYEVVGNALANKITGSGAGGGLSGEGGNDLILGGNGNDGLGGGAGADTMVGGKGSDTYFVDERGDKVVETGPAGQFDQIFSTIAYVLGANLEGLILSGGDNINGTGNSLNNFMEGNIGKNVVNGLAGNDTIEAGPGADTLVGGVGSDEFQFIDKNLDGVDVIADFDGLPGGDKLSISTLVGVLSAGTESKFIQTVVVDGSTVIQLALDGSGAGPDAVVLQGVSTDLDGLLANGSIVDVGTAATTPIDGTAGADNKVGTGVSNLIRGFGGNDTLSGLAGFDTLDGGAGNDSLIGGSESDAYVVNSAGDKIDETGGGTDDRILASIAINLTNAAYAGIEHVTLSGVAALSATGNGGANMLIGNAGANKLDGGLGADTLIGGAGNDTYILEGADEIIEYADGGIDLVVSSVAVTKLGDYLENLTLVAGAFEGAGNVLANKMTGDGTSNILHGGDGNDTLTGNDGNDSLEGDAGADLLIGGKGDDRYFVDNIGDKVVESGPAADTDLVLSEISYVLGATIEDLQLLGNSDIDGTGNGLDNAINGNDGNNVLRGMAGDDRMDGGFSGLDLLLGGDGNDTLSSAGSQSTMVGGSGSDLFQIDGGGIDPVDVIADFNGLPGGDVLLIAGVDFDPMTSILDDFVRTTTADGNTKISVDGDGALNGVNFVEVAVLRGVSTSAQALMDSGSLDLQGAI